jgi:hypothetical protein
MPALGLALQNVMSALPPKADMCSALRACSVEKDAKMRCVIKKMAAPRDGRCLSRRLF